ncbi:MAG TPA: helix-turn-helix domain-containing protein [Gemmatimonadaceae bacterium]
MPMDKDKTAAAHVGAFIRDKVIPVGMSVKEAAGRLGIGRPALSNLLNGNASLSQDMAARLEKAFGADQRQLLDAQAAFERKQQDKEQKAIPVRAYVPSLLTIKAAQIENWAQSNLEARQHLPVLLRRLIHSTGHELRHVDFPGYDNAERKGADGFVEAGAATAWIPEGISYWEFGVNQKPASKAEADYKARTGSVSAEERAQSTFVFLTPRNWPGKTEWAKNKSAAREWKTVRALDASDLEQWLEESLPGQAWLAERLLLPVTGFETLDQCWHDWSTASDPPMHAEVFASSIAAYRRSFSDWLDKQSDRPFVVAADSKDEALAFLGCLFADSTIAPRDRDLAVVIESAQTLKKLVAATSPFIPIVTTDEAERELAPIYRRLHSIAIRPRNAVDSEPDIALDLLGDEAFEKALQAMGVDREGADRLAVESGRSPTILRRRLSPVPAIRIPRWADDAETARALIPMTFVGAWHAQSNADREIVSILANAEYREVEQAIAKLRLFDDPPVWSVGRYQGVASKVDALFAINKVVTRDDLSGFLMLCEYVLSESDPALELPEDQRWAAGIYGKVREHSAVLRRGVCETLVLLAVHGNSLFRERLGLDIEAEISNLVRRLLTPLALEKFLSHDNELPHYAEAAPDAFLSLLEADLRQAAPVVVGLLKPASTGLFSCCPRTGLLWALECLAWKPESLVRVVKILGQLSRTSIDDNWTNKPIASLSAIFRSWMPQTAAALDQRLMALDLLARGVPDVAWQICLQQFEPGPRIGHYSYRPRWRSDASGAGQVVTRKENNLFARHALDLTLAWQPHDQRTLGDLVERIAGLADEDALTVWDLVDKWSRATTDNTARAELRERIRMFALTRRSRLRSLKAVVTERARDAFHALEPSDLAIRHGWLFAKQWIEASAEELEVDELDYAKREERIDALRAAAMSDLWGQQGLDGIMALLARSAASHTVGHYAARCLDPANGARFVRGCLGTASESDQSLDGCLQGFLASIDDDARSQFIREIAAEVESAVISRLVRLAPFGRHVWRQLDEFGADVRNSYWRDVHPYWNRHSEAEMIELVDRLLEVHRPRAAFNAIHFDWEKLETSRLKRLLFAVATDSAERSGEYKLDAHDLSSALQSLDGRTGVTREDMARLEFLFVEALEHSQHGIPNLEKQIGSSPTMFVQAVAMVYRRDDGGEDPPEWRIGDPQSREAIARTGHRLLEQLRRIPGTDDAGSIDVEALRAWLTEVRDLFAQHRRVEIGDYCIGELFSDAPHEKDGTWPCRPVCEAMEGIASEGVARGFYIGVHNSRGAQWRGEGGKQERELAARYRHWSQQLSFDYPYVSSVLERIAASYDHEAEWHDSDARVEKRLRH